jgi:hypothetical protein
MKFSFSFVLRVEGREHTIYETKEKEFYVSLLYAHKDLVFRAFVTVLV